MEGISELIIQEHKKHTHQHLDIIWEKSLVDHLVDMEVVTLIDICQEEGLTHHIEDLLEEIDMILIMIVMGDTAHDQEEEDHVTSHPDIIHHLPVTQTIEM